MHYYQFNIGDYARDTSHLSVIEHGIYRLLLDWCYLNEKPIPTDKALRVGRGYPEETQSVLSEFFSLSDDGWLHSRVASEVQKFYRKAETNRQNGAKGGRPVSEKNPVGSHPQPIRNPNQEPITNNQEPRTKVEKEPRKRVTPSKPDDVDQQTWDDWIALRKAKRAPVTQTVIDGAVREAGKAGMTLESFLQVWCRRGSQGLEAAWLKPEERSQPMSFAQQAADIARMTVPSKPGRDPALLQIEADREKAVPIPENIKARLAALKGGAGVSA
jgi:uncharacterized protein YdaU (DUF1376 family)